MASEKSVRPKTLEEYKGQNKAKMALSVYIKASKIKNETLDHVLISAPSGIGKSTLAQIITNEMGSNMRTYSCPAIKKVDEIVDILSSVQEGEILFFDEIHRLSNKISEALFLSMETFTVNSNIDGLQETMNLPHFTVVGATTNLGDCPEPLINRFQIKIALQPYADCHMADIVRASYKAMNIEIEDDCADLIAKASRGVPRIANSNVRRIYDFALVMNNGKIDANIIESAFEFMGINKYGLNEMDTAYLRFLKEAKKSVGVASIAMALNTDVKTIEKNVEPYLSQCGYIYKSPRGRMITEKGKKVI